jgi:hypothetical protein
MSNSGDKNRKIERPAEHYRTPADVADDPSLSADDRKKALDTWEQDAHQLLTASGEGMPGSEEGIRHRDHHRLGEVGRAKQKIGVRPKHRPAQ